MGGSLKDQGSKYKNLEKATQKQLGQQAKDARPAKNQYRYTHKREKSLSTSVKPTGKRETLGRQGTKGQSPASSTGFENRKSNFRQTRDKNKLSNQGSQDIEQSEQTKLEISNPKPEAFRTAIRISKALRPKNNRVTINREICTKFFNTAAARTFGYQ